MTRPSLDFSLTLKKLKKNYPYAHCALNFTNAFELLIATILSAQCTDERVNRVTEVLFKRYPNPQSMAKASVEDLEAIIRSTGFYKMKAKNIQSCCRDLVTKYKNQVPADMDSLTGLAGVGRKTANVVLGNAFNIASGVVVDTHVSRLSYRFGWVSKSDDPVKIENKLNKMCPQSDWIILSHYLIAHGREICKARSPNCEACFLFASCPRRGI